MIKRLIGLVFLVTMVAMTKAQEVKIDKGGGEPDPSAMLDVESTTKGMLVPRMTTTQRTAISSPATGLLVFDTTEGSFFFYNGTIWIDLSGEGYAGDTTQLVDGDGDTKIITDSGSDDDIIRMNNAGTEYFQFNKGRLSQMNTGQSVFLGDLAGLNDDLTTNSNTLVGYKAGAGNSTGIQNTHVGANTAIVATGSYNTSLGYNALNYMTTGNSNTALGWSALETMTNGTQNVGVGFSALQGNATGDLNAVVGYQAGSAFTGNNSVGIGAEALKTGSGSNNIAIGRRAKQSFGTGANNVVIGVNAMINNTSSNNVAIGDDAGQNNTTGSGNVFLGYNAGQNETGNNKLYIDNSNAASPLIYGDFSTNDLEINGDLAVDNGNLDVVNDGGNQFTISTVSTTSNDAVMTLRSARNSSTSNDHTQINFQNYDDDLSSSNTLARITGLVTDAAANTGALAFYSFSNGSTASESMRITSAGDIGIGTTSPNRKLHLHNSSGNNTYLQITNQTSGSTSTDGLLIGQPSNNTYFYNYENGYMAFRTNNVERIRIEAGGDVGIGITNPTAKLHVNGTTNLAGNTTITGNNTTSGKTTTATFKVTGGTPGTDKVLVSDADGDATWQDVPSRKHTISMPAITYSDDALQSGTSFGTYGWNYRYVEFEESKQEDMALSFLAPQERTSNTVTMRVYYTSTTTGGNFRVFFGTKTLDDDETSVGDSPGGNWASWTGPTTSNQLKVYTRTFNIGTDDYVFMIFRRNGTDNTNDTSTGSLRILGVAFDIEM